MFSTPGLEKGIDEEEAPLEAICQINAMIKNMTNKIPLLKTIAWNADPTKKDTFLIELPDNLDIAEKQIYDFNRF